MKNQTKYHLDDDLLRKYLTGELSAEESKDLNKDLESDPSLRQFLEHMERIWKLSGSFRELQSIDKESDWNEMRRRFTESDRPLPEHTGSQSGSLLIRITRIAAIFVLVSLASYMLYYFTGQDKKNNRDLISVNSGMAQQQIHLPDGSDVTLNKGSSLVYPEKFKAKTRRVMIEGEAFFEVARDEKRPFIINISDQASVEVLGTSFNLRQDPEKNRIFLDVISGRVAFFAKGKKKEAGIFEQDEHAVYESGSIKQFVSLDLNFLSWENNTLKFENTPLPEVAAQLGRHFRKEIQLKDNSLDSLALTAVYNNPDMDEVFAEIGLVLDIEFREEGNIIQVSLPE